MAYKVEFTVPKRELQRNDIDFDVHQDNKKLGRLRISQGGVDWVRTNGGKKNTYSFKWDAFDRVMKDNGQNS